MRIQVRIESKYGRRLVYPVCDTAKLFATLVQRITLTDQDIQTIKRLGYSIEVVQQAL